MITQQIMFAKTLSLYLHWHGYRLNVIKLLPHKTTKSIKQLYSITRQEQEYHSTSIQIPALAT